MLFYFVKPLSDNQLFYIQNEISWYCKIHVVPQKELNLVGPQINYKVFM